ncbi:MAG: 2-aminobenzoate-CoA ligase, partial [Gemmatimonadaceae bacterium]
MTERSGHTDGFCREALPPRSLWPEMRYDRIPELAYPARLNCAGELLDRMVARGYADRTAFRFPEGSWTYSQLLEFANQLA